MQPKELHEARTNPEFLSYLEHREKEVFEQNSISGLYEVLDTLLVLNLDEQRVNKVYEQILKLSFDKIEQRLKEHSKLSLENDDLYFIRSFYEHAIEKWSVENFDGAKELFFILSQITEDQNLVNSINIHLLACANGEDMDKFYDEKIDQNFESTQEKYGYFIMGYKFNTEDYLQKHSKDLEEQYNKLKHLLN